MSYIIPPATLPPSKLGWVFVIPTSRVFRCGPYGQLQRVSSACGTPVPHSDSVGVCQQDPAAAPLPSLQLVGIHSATMDLLSNAIVCT